MSKSTDQHSGLVSIARLPRRMPASWEPPAPAWAASFPMQSTPVVMAYFGTQLGSPDPGSIVEQRIYEFFDCADAPQNVESAKFTDRSGCRNFISAAYWTNPASYERWTANSRFDAWWNEPARQSGRQGHYREILTVPTDRFETIFSNDCVVGVAKTGGPVVGPIREHNYWGSMRDRLQVSASDELASTYGDRLPRLGSSATVGRRLRVAVPENLAIIRSGQDWTDCAGAELATYNDSVAPALLGGMTFLRDHPDETGCCDLRFAQQTTRNGSAVNKTFGLGYFLSLQHLEKWAATHPTHLTIFSRFGKMVREYGVDLKLKLWHEVSILPAADQIFEYINCHAETGLLPYFPSQEF
jgi:aldoxime dehydratase